MQKKPDTFQPGLVTLGAFLLIGLLIYMLDEVLPGPYGSDAALKRARELEGDYKSIEALEYYDKAIRLNPTRHDAYFARALHRNRLGETDRALSDYSEAIRLKPDFAAAYYNRGLINAALGQIEPAIADYQSAHRYDPKRYGCQSEISRNLPGAWTV